MLGHPLTRKRAMGLEPTTFSLEGCNPESVTPSRDKDLQAGQNLRAAPGAARSAAKGDSEPHQSLPDDPNLRAIVDAWPTLPQPVRAGILAMVRAATQSGE